MSFDPTKYILLFESCQLTKGYGRTLLVDFQRKQMEFFDNELYAILTHYNRSLSIGEILDRYNDVDRTTIIEYFDFLLNNEFAFLCDKQEVNFFPKLDLRWDNPAKITNCIIDFDQVPDSIDPYLKAITDLDHLGCENIQIRDFGGVPVDFLTQLISHCNLTILHRVELLVKVNGPLETYIKLLENFPIVNELILHSADNEFEIKTGTSQKAFATTRELKNSNCCGVISVKHFNVEMYHFLESNNFNTCLNRKISIDVHGNIKNCPSLKRSFGLISETRLRDVAENEDFSKLWNIKKDSIDDCKVCEFRHICTDCRAFSKDDISYEKPAKCTYDPYKMQWGTGPNIEDRVL